MEKIYICGHRNPDIDSVLSAAAYAKFKSILDPDHEYVAVRCGHLSQNVKRVFSELQITPPPYMHDVYPKVKDVMLTADSRFEADEPLSDLSDGYSVENPSATPVFENGKFFALLTVDALADWFMKSLKDEKLRGTVPLVRDAVGLQGEPLDSEERFEEAKALLTSSRLRGLPVLKNDEFVGFVTKRCFLRKASYKVIMVDHNEPEQSIPGVETADIIEIIDHHRLDSVKTDVPIFIDAEPVGSTCTIVYQLYRRNMMTPDRETAKQLLTGILADTLILKSPTTTIVDVRSAQELSWITGEDVQTYGHKMFSVMESLSSRDPKEAIQADFKTYQEHGVHVGIGQIETATLGNLDAYKDTYLATLEEVRTSHALDWALVMITDVLHEESILLVSDFKSNRHLPYPKLSDFVYDMPNVMSRKKQLLPEVVHSISIDFGA